MTGVAQDLAEKLNENGYKLTAPRREILNVLPKMDRHFSAEDLWGLLRKRGQHIGMATVYRTIHLLTDLRLVRRLNFGERHFRYEIVESDQRLTEEPLYLVCVQCGRVIELETGGTLGVRRLERELFQERLFKVRDRDFKLFGYCSKCVEQ